MEGIKKKFSFTKTKVNSDSVVDGPFTETNGATATEKNTQTPKNFEVMPPDKQLEKLVLQTCFEHLSVNLPPDDVAIVMNSKALITAKEHEKYMGMKRAHITDSDKSEYLLQCLGRRKPGFLTRFCEILRGIEQTSYLADDIVEEYKRVKRQIHGSNSKLDGISLSSSLSDPDIHSKGYQELPRHECTRCKVLERRNNYLEKRCQELKQQQKVYETVILPFKPLAEVAQEQLQRAFTEASNLTQLLPTLQESVTKTTTQITAVQVSLDKMNNMLAEGREKHQEVSSKGERAVEGILVERRNSTHITQENGGSDHLPDAFDQHDEHTSKPNMAAMHHTQEGLPEEPDHFPALRQHRAKSESAAMRRQRFTNQRNIRSVDSKPKPAQNIAIDTQDPQLQLLLKLRRDQIEASDTKIQH